MAAPSKLNAELDNIVNADKNLEQLDPIANKLKRITVHWRRSFLPVVKKQLMS